MDPKQLASTTMDPKTRILQRVSIEDAVVADRAVRELMVLRSAIAASTLKTCARRALLRRLTCSAFQPRTFALNRRSRTQVASLLFRANLRHLEKPSPWQGTNGPRKP